MKAIEDREKARIEVLKSNTEEKRQILAQKQKACKQIIRREKRIWEVLRNKLTQKTKKVFFKTNKQYDWAKQNKMTDENHTW